MSTRCTLETGDGWHLYQDWADPGLVFLEWWRKGACITLEFTVDEWERMRTAAPQDLNWNNFDIDELIAVAKGEKEP